MNEYNNDTNYNNYMTPLKISKFNNYLKKIVSDKLATSPNLNSKPPLTKCLVPKLKRTITLRKIHDDSSEERSVLKFQNPQNSPKTQTEIKKMDVIHVNIDVEINAICDLLELIDKYKIDPKIHYNINMESLHKIKQPLTELNNMIGMKELKTNVVGQIIYFIQELHTTSHDFMHTVIYGPPGTGKTEIAKIMGKIFSNIGLLSKDTFKKVTRSDLIAGYVGQTALKTRDVIKDSLGGVLFIDEAYSLGHSDKKDSFSKECIDTLCEALSNHKQDLMVIIAGYENELNQCFFNYNQGLESRFAWRFKTDEYSGKDLHDIFIKKVNEIDWTIAANDNNNGNNNIITPMWFEKNIEYFKYYGRDIECLLAKTKIAHSKRVFCKDKIDKKNLTLEDLNNGLNLYLKNSETQNVHNSNLLKKQLQYSMYN